MITEKSLCLQPGKAEKKPQPEKRIHYGKAPVMNCPVCEAKAHTRSSIEIDPTYRQLYYRCSNDECGMTWVASLLFERVLSPSGISAEFRPARQPEGEKPPGHDFGQMTIFEALAKTPG